MITLRNRFSTYSVIPLTAALAICILPVGAQERHKLEQQKEQLEKELKRVTEKIYALDSQKGSPTDEADVTPKHFIEAFGIYTVNSAGGVEPSLTLRNSNQKSPIKYARIAIQLFDRVGKIQQSTIGTGSPTQWLSFTGPLSSDDPPHKGQWEPIWYNRSGWCIKIVELHLEFLDGSHRSFSGKSINKVIKDGLENTCPLDGPRYQE